VVAIPVNAKLHQPDPNPFMNRGVAPPMCGRFGLFSPAEIIVAKFGIKETTIELAPRYNVAPEQDIAVIIQNDARKLVEMRWGLIPFWTKEPALDLSTINARAETLELKPTYRHSFKNRRCLIPVDGFYEWKGKAGTKTPYFIRLKSQEPFAFAGLYDLWESPTAEVIASATIVTTTPNELLSWIHNRMPVILSDNEYETWLSKENVDPSLLKSLLDPFPSAAMQAYEVSTYVNSPSNEGPKCIKEETT
jgi:putative SOS response-associated peptidase YedK